ncbi:hypothetical protein GBA52_021874 [Prunus armeniaca]|nr:hypothetical protein GBA52_021874 [Prunus armeniaca]
MSQNRPQSSHECSGLSHNKHIKKYFPWQLPELEESTVVYLRSVVNKLLQTHFPTLLSCISVLCLIRFLNLSFSFEVLGKVISFLSLGYNFSSIFTKSFYIFRKELSLGFGNVEVALAVITAL